MVDFGGAQKLLFDWILSPFIWFALIFVFIAATIGFLWIRKRRKLIYDVLEIVDYDSGKAGFNLIRGGWFGKKKFLKGLYDYGEERVETQDGDVVLDFSTTDFQEINGKRGIVVTRDPVNPDILAPINKVKTVPIKKVNIVGKELFAEIAPADFRAAALDIIEKVDRETADWTKQVVQWVLIGATIIFALVAIIVIVQMVKHGQTEAANLITSAGETCLKNAKEVCQQIATTAKSSAP